MINDITLQIAEKAKENIKNNDCDYTKDGLLYCGKCNTPKQHVTFWGGKKNVVYVLCECEAAARDKRETELKKAEQLRKIERLRTNGIKDIKLLNCTFENDRQPDSQYSKLAKRYCDQWEEVTLKNTGLILTGDTGVGKSYLAACIANSLIDKGIAVLYRTESDMLDEYYDTHNKSGYIENISRIPLLIIDDFGTRRGTTYATEQLKKIIDKRYYANKPTIFTTNLTADDFNRPKNIDEKRIYERVKAMGIRIEIVGKNWRIDEAAEKALALEKIIKQDKKSAAN